MKKRVLTSLTAVGVLSMFSVSMILAEDATEATDTQTVSVIGGSDGPTAVFLAGKLGEEEEAASETNADAEEETETVSESDAEMETEAETAPEISYENGVISADEWKDTFPEVYASYQANDENNYTVDHVEEYPQIAKIYEGMAFNEFYNSAQGHTYTLEDVAATGRPHALANCLTCKTPDYTALVNEMGDGAYKLDFEEVYSNMKESISCYNCHENQVLTGSMVVTHSYLKNAMGEDLEKVAPQTLSCAQCHVEYYFDPETKATTLPYDNSTDALSPEAILEYYNEMDFSDYTNPRTGTGQIKVQHPEFETYTGVGSIHNGTYTCADCHMGKTTTDTGTFTNHKWQSPLENEELTANSCASCHEDLEAEVKAIQEEAEARTNEIADRLEVFTDDLAEVVEQGDASEEELETVRSLNRDAQFYWDFVFVENSEGAHNSSLTAECLDRAEELLTQAEEELAALTADTAAKSVDETE